jgi:ketosteroid isomerase-like protein
VSEVGGELLSLEHRWAKALRNMDREALEDLLAPEFRLSFVNDPRAPRTAPREEWFAMLGRMSFGEYEVLCSQEVLFGEVGVLHMHVRFEDWRLDGNLLPSDYRVTDVFVRRGGKWLVVNRISEPAGKAPEFWK